MAKQRETQHAKGYDDAVEDILMLLTVAIEAYPQAPGERTIQRIMPAEIACKFLELLDLFHERIAGNVAQRIEEVARGGTAA